MTTIARSPTFGSANHVTCSCSTISTLRRVLGVTVHAGNYRATFRPDCAMLCTSLRYRAEEFVAWPRPISQFRAGHATAIPLLHPWANRLSRWGYGRVDLRGQPLPADKNGLPMHGNLLGRPFEVQRFTDDRVVATLAYDDPRAFPFPHTITVDARIHAEHGLRITTIVEPTGKRAVPISFGWHPYVRLPNAPRSE